MIDLASIIPKLKQEADRTASDIKRLFDDRTVLRHLLRTAPDLYNELSIHEWHPTLAWERAARYQPAPSEHCVCPRCYVISGQTRYLMEIDDTTTLVECAYCSYKLYPQSTPQAPMPEDGSQDAATKINFDVHGWARKK